MSLKRGESDRKEVKLSMFWKKQLTTETRLSRCAIGVLKDFSFVSSVNRRLINIDFSFSFLYLGDKSVLWCFNSKVDKEGFIKIRFFWDDCFLLCQDGVMHGYPKRSWLGLVSMECP